jgi:hypothetical protein
MCLNILYNLHLEIFFSKINVQRVIIETRKTHKGLHVVSIRYVYTIVKKLENVDSCDKMYPILKFMKNHPIFLDLLPAYTEGEPELI